MKVFRFSQHEPGTKLLHLSLILLISFLFLFPKGGIKLGSTPITWGYLLLGGLAFLSIFKKRYILNRNRLYILIALIPFQMITTYTVLSNGVIRMGYFTSLVTSFFILPWIFFFALSRDTDRFDLKVILEWIKKGTLFLALYGILLFIYKFATGEFIEIPFLTVNYHDAGEMDDKCIDRGTVFKLISTYNNGNIFGICLLMTLPLYNLIETNSLKKMIVKLSLVLTISRTIWIGLVFVEGLYELFVTKNKWKFIVKFFGSLTFITISVVSIAIYFELFTMDFFFDAKLGGRIDQFDILDHFAVFSSEQFDDIGEVVYLGILRYFGSAGLLAYLIAMLCPIFLFSTRHIFKKEWSKIDRSILCGLTTYLVISWSDGALLYIPVMVFYWFLSSLLQRENKPSLKQILNSKTTKESEPVLLKTT